MRRLYAAFLAGVVLSGCSDDPTTPSPAFIVQIQQNGLPFEEQTVAPGSQISLTARLSDRSGKEVPKRPVAWKSSRPEIVQIDTNGHASGQAEGSALIIASVGEYEDTARINVALPVSGEVRCDAGDPGSRLEVGQVWTTTAWEANTLCLQGGGQGAEYVLIPFHASQFTGTARLPLEVTATDVLAPAESPSAARLPVDAAAREEWTLRDTRFHLKLRERSMAKLTRRAHALHAAPSATTPSMARTPNVGDMLELNVEVGNDDGCADPRYRTARVMAVSRHALVVADTSNPAPGFTSEEYREFGTAFDELVYPVSVENFGEPSDVDGNRRTIIFFTGAVNDLTRRGSGFYVAGFFFDRDLFPRTGQAACEGSNNAEMLYMMVPDPARASQEPVFQKERVKQRTLAVVGHEMQHLVNASRRLHVQKAPTWETTWLNEGLSHIAEELLFYRVAGLSPRGNQDGEQLQTTDDWSALNSYQLDNFERLANYLRTPEGGSPIGEDALATRGAIWGFLRYAADRAGGSERDFWKALVNSKTSGFENLEAVVDGSARDWMQDWTISNYTDDADFETESRYSQPSWNFRAFFTRLDSYSRYPLRTRTLRADSTLSLELHGGSSAYLRFGVGASQRAALRVTSGGLPGPQKLRLAVVRTR